MSVDAHVLAAAMAMTLRMAGGCRHSPNMRRACALATMDFLSSTSTWVLCGTKRGGLSSVLRSDLLLRGLFPPVPRLGRFGVELGDLCPSALSVRPQTRLNFGHEWLESGPKTNNGPFAPACWAAVLFVYRSTHAAGSFGVVRWSWSPRLRSITTSLHQLYNALSVHACTSPCWVSRLRRPALLCGLCVVSTD